jgi:hypothetical protein
MTPFETQAQILGDLWMDYREDAEFKDFIEKVKCTLRSDLQTQQYQV